MPTPLTPWGRKALELLADGQWHARAELIDAMTPLIPPGVAFRQAEFGRNRPAQRPNGPGPRVRGDDETSIAGGRRHIAVQQLISLCREDRRPGARAERALIDGVDSIRIAPAQTKVS